MKNALYKLINYSVLIICQSPSASKLAKIEKIQDLTVRIWTHLEDVTSSFVCLNSRDVYFTYSVDVLLAINPRRVSKYRNRKRKEEDKIG